MRRIALVAAFALSCGAPGAKLDAPRADTKTPEPDAGPVKLAAGECGASVDVPDLYARHARTFGDEAAVAASLPVTLPYALSQSGKAGTETVVMDAGRYRDDVALAGTFVAQGIDERGPWSLGAPGVLVRPRGPRESTRHAFESWVLRRAYLSAKPATSTCAPESGRALVALTFKDDDLGQPVLTFDRESAMLVRFSSLSAMGARETTTTPSWTDANASGARWPKTMLTNGEVGDPSTAELSTAKQGLACVHDDADPPVACVRAPKPKLAWGWPKATSVKVPFKLAGGEISLRAKIDGREVWAFLDSGAGISVLDADTKAGQAFVPLMEITGASATQKVKLGLGELARVSVGDLTLEHLPVASVPIPALAVYGARRPEIVLGSSLFFGAAVRIDYAHEVIELAKNADAWTGDGSKLVALPMVNLGDIWAASASIEGRDAEVEIDTGNAVGLSLRKAWVTKAGLLDGRPTLETKGNSSAGSAETTDLHLRVRTVSFGAIQFDGRIASVTDPPGTSTLAGLLGNPVLARCAAVVFDQKARTLWLEPPCDRALAAENLGGWKIVRKEDPAHPDRPFVVERTLAGGSADKGGVLKGDRVLRVDGKPAVDQDAIETSTARAAGTRVSVDVLRGGETKKLTLVLAPIL